MLPPPPWMTRYYTLFPYTTLYRSTEPQPVEALGEVGRAGGFLVVGVALSAVGVDGAHPTVPEALEVPEPQTLRRIQEHLVVPVERLRRPAVARAEEGRDVGAVDLAVRPCLVDGGQAVRQSVV